MASIFTSGVFEGFDSNGDPLAGGKLYTYAAGTTTPLASYTNQGGGTPNANPVVLDSAGRANVWLGSSAYRLLLKTSADVTVWDTDNVRSDAFESASLSASTGSSLVGHIATGAGAVATTVQTKLRERITAKDKGAVADFATDNTAAVQNAIDSLGAYGGTVYVNEGCKFNLRSLVLPARCNLDYRVDDDTSAPGPSSDIASSERVFFSSNSSQPAGGAIVNEWRLTAPFHPGLIVDVRKDVTSGITYAGAGQTLDNPARASYSIHDEQTGRFVTTYKQYKDWNIFSGIEIYGYRVLCVLNGIGTAQWSSVPAEDTTIIGTTSGARGTVISVAAGSTTVLWMTGKFVTGETVSDDNETTTATITSVTTTSTPNQWLIQGFKRGNWSVGLPATASTHAFAVGGKIAATITRAAGQYIDAAVANPAFVLVDNYELPTVSGFEITYNTTPNVADRRLTLRNLGSTADRAHLGAVHAHVSFANAATKSTSSYNVASITRNGTGDYTVNFTNAAARADFSTVVSTTDPMQYAYVFAVTTGVVRIKVVTTGTSTLVDLSGLCHVVCLGGDI